MVPCIIVKIIMYFPLYAGIQPHMQTFRPVQNFCHQQIIRTAVRPGFLQENDISVEKEHKDRIDQLAEQGKTVVYLLSEDRPEAVAKTVADQLHLDDYLAENLPDEKSDQIK